MKPQKFYDPHLPMAPLLFICMIPLSTIIIIMGIYCKIWEESLLLTLGVLFIGIACAYVCIHYVLEIFPTLSVYQDIGKIIWKLGIFRKIEMNVTECMFVSVQEEKKFSKMKSWLPEKTVDEFAYYICFSTLPIDPQYSRKITKLRVKEGFIRFTYSDKLALTLMDVLPKERTVQLKTFFDYMQTKKRTSKK